MTIEEKERDLIEEVNFFNQNTQWWEMEINKVTHRLMRLELNNFQSSDLEERDKLIAQFTYLTSKAKTEKRAAKSIENKIRKLRLERELQIIQGDSEISTKKKKIE